MKAVFVIFAFSLIAAAADPVADGRAIYVDKCASCHAVDGSGDVPRGKAMKAPDLRLPATQKKTDAELIRGILESKRHPAFNKMSKDDLAKVVTHMRSFHP
jgi:mono/diheme cytochrome c family protein